MDGAQILEEVICRLGGKEGRTCLTKHVCVDSMWGGCRMRTGREVGGEISAKIQLVQKLGQREHSIPNAWVEARHMWLELGGQRKRRLATVQ